MTDSDIAEMTMLMHRIAYYAGPTPLVICEDNGDLLGLNRAAETMFGVASDGLRGTHVGRLLPQFPAACAYGVASDGTFACRIEETKIRVGQRLVRTMAVHREASSQPSKPAAVVGAPPQRPPNTMALMRSLAKAAEVALLNLEELARLAPAPAKSATVTAMPTPTPAAQSAQRESRRVREALQTMLDLSALEQDLVESRHSPIELDQVFATAVHRAAAVAMPRDVLVLYRIDANAPAFCISDCDLLTKAVDMVVQHALRRTTRGQLTIEATAEPLATRETSRPGNLAIEISVRDTSVGASRDELASWLRYPRYEDVTTTRHSVGLLSALRAMQHLGGGIELDSEVNLGTSYRMRFIATSAPGQAPPWRGLQSGLVGRPVAIVDTGIGTSALLKSVLREWGAKANVFSTNAAAIAAFHAKPGAIVVTTLSGKPLGELLERASSKVRHFVVLERGAPHTWQPFVDAGVRHGAPIALVTGPFRLAALLHQVLTPTLVTSPAAAISPASAPKAKEMKPVLTKAAVMAPASSFPRPGNSWNDVATLARQPIKKRTTMRPPMATPSLRILASLADGNRRAAIMQDLARLGYRVDVAAPGKATRRALEALPFDVVIVDDIDAREDLDTLVAAKMNSDIVIVGLISAEGSKPANAHFDEAWTYPVNPTWGRRLDQFATRRRPRPPSASKASPARQVNETRPYQPARDNDVLTPPTRKRQRAPRDGAILASVTHLVEEHGIAEAIEFLAMYLAALHHVALEMREVVANQRRPLVQQLLALAGNVGADQLCALAQEYLGDAGHSKQRWSSLIDEIDEVCLVLERHVRGYRRQQGAARPT